MTTIQFKDNSNEIFAIAPCGGEFKVTNRQTGEHIGYYMSRAAADNAAVLAMRAITDAAAR